MFLPFLCFPMFCYIRFTRAVCVCYASAMCVWCVIVTVVRVLCVRYASTMCVLLSSYKFTLNPRDFHGKNVKLHGKNVKLHALAAAG